MIRWAEPRICAFDIETTKLPLQFPNAEYDQVSLRGVGVGAGSLGSLCGAQCALKAVDYEVAVVSG